jgi:hypothetical protein
MEAHVEFELELEPDKNKNEPSSNEGYSLKIGSITPLIKLIKSFFNSRVLQLIKHLV